MSELPKGWKKEPLGTFVRLKNGYAFKSKDFVAKSENTFPVVRISDIQHGRVLVTDSTHIESAIANFKFTVESGDLLIAMSGATTGKTGVYRSTEVAFQNQRVGNLKLVDEQNSCPRYRNYLIASLKEEIIKKAYGAAQPNISAKELEGIEVNIAPFDEQKRIADKLDSVLAKVEAAQARLDKIPAILKRFRQSVLAAATSGELTKDWRATQGLELSSWNEYLFEDISTQITVGFVGKMADKYVESGIPFLRSQNVRPFKFDERNLLFISEDFHQKIYKSRLEAGDLAIVRSGAPGTTCVIPENLGVVNCSDLVIVRPSEKLVSEYGCIFMNSTAAQGTVKANQVGVAQQHFNVGSMKKMLINLPTKHEQEEIVFRVNQLFEHSYLIEKKYEMALIRVKKLEQSILSKAFKGELLSSSVDSDIESIESSVETLNA
ncbi:restriction endonuclease subunit S [Alteromonas lipolytica]|uniref:Type I restriction modification DNA specificity domain-containing protein n=1 Tax=Alteromonas lipolytica TaxID=1856405 RepID=A0A1E8FDB3_9ALTE|nr:restriction endonuclease subunit S [Alteromonas lipolytica]OFI33911.1 hypothetical protein BFC17_20315 [Alteromonas lipolytica]GGF67348.1 type-1 restriction enzyme EcoKI specificity protein [Alteromonas lipolytica]